MSRKIGFAVALFGLAVVLFVNTAAAGTFLAFSPARITSMKAQRTAWLNCSSVTIDVPEAGYVIVSATGNVVFPSNSILVLTLSNTTGVGPWKYGITATPPYSSNQSYSLRQVFTVSAGTNTFFLNSRGFSNNPGGVFSIQNGSMTAEFYPAADVQPPVSALAGEGPKQSIAKPATPRGD